MSCSSAQGAQELWREFNIVPSQNFQNANLSELLNGCLHIMEDMTRDNIRRRAIPWMLWTIWKNMNNLLYAEVQESTSMLVHRALEESTLYIIHIFRTLMGRTPPPLKVV